MKLFASAHATHPDWTLAVGLVVAQLRSQLALPAFAPAPSLGLIYLTDHFAAAAQEILDQLSADLPEVSDWSGTVGVGIAASNAEYFDEPALAVMLCDVPVDQYRVFSGVAPLPRGFAAQAALVHGDPAAPDVGELIHELAARTSGGYLFGGLASSRTQSVQLAWSGTGNLRGQGRAGGVFSGGVSGVAWGPGVRVVSRVTQGCFPLSRARTITACDAHVLLELDGQPALDVLLSDLNVSLSQPREALEAVRATLVGIADGDEGSRRVRAVFGDDVVVRHIIGLDPGRRGVAVAERLRLGQTLSFCRRNVEAARSDLMRICAEIRDEVEPEQMSHSAAMELAVGELALHAGSVTHDRPIRGAIYVSCTGRGGPHFGGPSAELQIVRRALGDVPLVGFFASGEIAHHRLYGYTGVLTVFAGDADPA